MTVERAWVGWGFWVRWVLACIVGQQLWWVLDWIVGQAVGGRVSGLAWILVATATFAFSVGMPQWFLLRQYVPRAGWWVLAIFLGLGVGLGVNLVVGPAVFPVEDSTVISAVAMALRWAIFGSAIGIAQWFVLRRHFSRAGWWVLASTVGFGVAFAVGVVAVVVGGVHGTGKTLEEARAMAEVLTGVVEGLVAGAIYGAITGGALVWLQRHPLPSTQKA